jgi:hypothetical protein
MRGASGKRQRPRARAPTTEISLSTRDDAPPESRYETAASHMLVLSIVPSTSLRLAGLPCRGHRAMLARHGAGAERARRPRAPPQRKPGCGTAPGATCEPSRAESAFVSCALQRCAVLGPCRHPWTSDWDSALLLPPAAAMLGDAAAAWLARLSALTSGLAAVQQRGSIRPPTGHAPPAASHRRHGAGGHSQRCRRAPSPTACKEVIGAARASRRTRLALLCDRSRAAASASLVLGPALGSARSLGASAQKRNTSNAAAGAPPPSLARLGIARHRALVHRDTGANGRVRGTRQGETRIGELGGAWHAEVARALPSDGLGPVLLRLSLCCRAVAVACRCRPRS